MQSPAWSPSVVSIRIVRFLTAYSMVSTLFAVVVVNPNCRGWTCGRQGVLPLKSKTFCESDLSVLRIPTGTGCIKLSVAVLSAVSFVSVWHDFAFVGGCFRLVCLNYSNYS